MVVYYSILLKLFLMSYVEDFLDAFDITLACEHINKNENTY